MKIKENDSKEIIREICVDIHKEIADILSEDFSDTNIEYREQYNDVISQLNEITTRTNKRYVKNLIDTVLESYDDNTRKYIIENYIDDIIDDEVQSQIAYLEENCVFDAWEDDIED